MTTTKTRSGQGPVWSPQRLKREREARRKRKGRRRPRKKPRPTRRHPPPTDLALLPAEAAEADALAAELGLGPTPGRSGEGGVKTEGKRKGNRFDNRAFLHSPPVETRIADHEKAENTATT